MIDAVQLSLFGEKPKRKKKPTLPVKLYSVSVAGYKNQTTHAASPVHAISRVVSRIMAQYGSFTVEGNTYTREQTALAINMAKIVSVVKLLDKRDTTFTGGNHV